jgi:hypothetical protein
MKKLVLWLQKKASLFSTIGLVLIAAGLLLIEHLRGWALAIDVIGLGFIAAGAVGAYSRPLNPHKEDKK